jgi:hypothetical protein
MVNPHQRATIDELRVHPWMNDGYDAPPPRYLPDLKDLPRHLEGLRKDIVGKLVRGRHHNYVWFSFSGVL